LTPLAKMSYMRTVATGKWMLRANMKEAVKIRGIPSVVILIS